MKVLVINWRDIKNPEAGGAEIHIDELLKRKPADWEVDFVSASFKGAPNREAINSYNVIRIPSNSLFNYTFRLYWRKEGRRRGYDLIIDDISKIPLATPRYIKNITIVALHHHVHGASLFKELSYAPALYVYTAEKAYLKYYQNTPIISVSESSKNELLTLYPFRNISVINNGVDVDVFKDTRKKPKTDFPSLVYLGRLKKYKRVDHIIRAFQLVNKKIPESRLFIVGKGDDELRLKALTDELKLTSAIYFHGFVSEEEKRKILSTAWVSAITSEKEGWGIGVIESNAAGTPVTGYDVPGLQDSIRDQYSGFLIENGNINMLAEKICLLFEDKELRKQYSQNAVQWAANFSWDSAAKQFYEKLNKIVLDFRSK
ncbi:MAG TPA: glycosyltransferase family 4 protein [Ignavibacteriales bacterium]|nr:glycosyltransferase family 4 protein [Ignavibacteriales bacterium]